MFIYKHRYSILSKAITLVLVCLFIVNDIAWAQDLVHNPPKSATLATLVGNPVTYSTMKQMMIARYASHQEPIDKVIDEAIKDHRWQRYCQMLCSGLIVNASS